LNKLRVQLDTSVKMQNISEIEKANSIVAEFFQANGIPCDPVVRTPPPADIALLGNFRLYLDDVQAFLRTQPNVAQEKIGDVALVAARLREAISKPNESEAKQFKARLDDLLMPVPGFVDFVADKVAGRARNIERQFALESAKAEKGAYFISEFLRENLLYPKTEVLLRNRARLEKSRRPSSISEASVNDLNKANAALDAFVQENSLSSDYSRIVVTFGYPPTNGPVLKPKLAVTPRTAIALAGPDEDLVFLYNSAASAPSIAKDITGKFVFLTGVASICFAQSTDMDEDRRWFLERTLRQDGAKEVKEEVLSCDFSKVPIASDIVVFQRSELRKQREDYVIGLTDLLQKDALREYRVVSAADYDAAVQGIRARSLQIGSDVEFNRTTGFGIIVVTDAGSPACAIAGDHVTEVGLSVLLQRNKQLISWRLRFDWNIINKTAESAFVELTRQQCGYAAGDAMTLQTLTVALRRDDRKYEFAPIWFSIDEVIDAGKDEIRRRDQVEREKGDEIKIDKGLRRQQGSQKQAIEQGLRTENGPRARALKDEIDRMVKADAFKALTDKPRVATETQGRFSTFATWLNRRFDDQWETTEVVSEVADYGKVQWNGRTLDGIMIQTNVTQKNRIKGAYEISCFIFGQVNDDEFSMRRNTFAVQCSSSKSALDDWKTRREFKSLWNAEVPQRTGTPG
jgi:hypothetical protein